MSICLCSVLSTNTAYSIRMEIPIVLVSVSLSCPYCAHLSREVVRFIDGILRGHEGEEQLEAGRDHVLPREGVLRGDGWLEIERIKHSYFFAALIIFLLICRELWTIHKLRMNYVTKIRKG